MAFNQFVTIIQRLCFWASDDIVWQLIAIMCISMPHYFFTISITPLHLLILIIKSSAKCNESCKDNIPSHKVMEGNEYMFDDYFHFLYLHSYTIYTLSKRSLIALFIHIIKICYWLTLLTFREPFFIAHNCPSGNLFQILKILLGYFTLQSTKMYWKIVPTY